MELTAGVEDGEAAGEGRATGSITTGIVSREAYRRVWEGCIVGVMAVGVEPAMRQPTIASANNNQDILFMASL